MSSCNVKSSTVINKEREQSAFETLQRTVMSCLLWEDNFYEDGVSVEQRITELSKKCSKEEMEQLVLNAKFGSKLRHVPLKLLCCMAENRQLTSELVEKVITRVDDMSELFALYWLNGKKPIPNQMKKGLQKAFTKFDEYQFGKYKGNGKSIKLRDVIRIVRPKPANKEQEELWGKIVKQTLATPDTWETAISATTNKNAEWTRLLEEKKLGALALLRNLRNITEAGVNSSLIASALSDCHPEKILPYQVFASAKVNPFYDEELNEVFLKSILGMDKLKGKTIILIDVSGSMEAKLSGKSDMRRCDVAGCLAAIAREICESVVIYTFNTGINEPIPNRRGLALVDKIVSKVSGGTYVYQSIVEAYNRNTDADRIICITDEQDNANHSWIRDDSVEEQCMKIGRKIKYPYILNVAPYQNGICYPKANDSWVHINGFSENVIKYIALSEK